MNKTLGILISLLILFLGGCATTKVQSVWMDQEYKSEKINSFFVIGVSRNDQSSRRIFEDEFVTQLKKRNVDAQASYRVISSEELLDEQTVAQKVKLAGVDAVLATRIVETRKGKYYMPPQYDYYPRYYGGWHGYYSRMYPVTPGYSVEYETIVLETTIFDTKSNKLIWSARSDAWAEASISKLINEFVGNILKKLAEDKLID